MRALLSDEGEAFLVSLAQPVRSGLRVNTLKIAPHAFLSRSPFALRSVPWCGEGYVLDDVGHIRPSQHPYYAAGLYYLQDPSAMAATVLLDPQPGECVLDLCAAPGSKATHIAARMQGDGVLVANEIIRGRAAVLAGNLEQFGAVRSLVTSETTNSLACAWPGVFDRVLVDAPCSGEGLFRRNPAACREWTLAGVDGCAARQDGILAAAADLVRPGGRLVYATCTFGPQENEAVVARFLRARGDYCLTSAPPLPGLSYGRPDWIAPELARGLPLDRCVRLWPHIASGEGHFIAVLDRLGDAHPSGLEAHQGALSGDARHHIGSFWDTTLGMPLPVTGWLVAGQAVYQAPVSPRAWRGVRVVQAGWRNGSLAHDRFEPSHALAMGLRACDARRNLTYEVGACQLAGYLRGETLPEPGSDGWLLVTCDGYPLGWGKRVRGVVKNHYPRHLRWR